VWLHLNCFNLRLSFVFCPSVRVGLVDSTAHNKRLPCLSTFSYTLNKPEQVANVKPFYELVSQRTESRSFCLMMISLHCIYKQSAESCRWLFAPNIIVIWKSHAFRPTLRIEYQFFCHHFNLDEIANFHMCLVKFFLKSITNFYFPMFFEWISATSVQDCVKQINQALDIQSNILFVRIKCRFNKAR